MKKKGFTLVELLAVIVILAVIALIATPIIINVIEEAKKGAAESCTYSYVNAIEHVNILSEMQNTSQITSLNTLNDINKVVKLKGKKPTYLYSLTIQNHKVSNISICINNYIVDYDGNKAKARSKCNEELEVINASQVEYIPEDDSINVSTVEEALNDLYNR